MKTSAFAALSVVSTLAVLGGVAAAVYFTWPKNQETGKSSLVGNFTILEKTIADVTDSSICSYLRAILTNAGLVTPYCTIIDKSPGSVRVRYNLEIDVNSDVDVVLNTASSAVARNSSDNSVFLINQSSITFEDRNGVVQNSCTKGTLCTGANSICISVVGGFECVCLVGYMQSLRGYGCVNATYGRYCEPKKTWIPEEKVCDKFQDCSDDSDEIDCRCNTSYQYGCRNGRCIYKDWLCDGVKDCPQGDDESPPRCSVCNASQFQCSKPHRCISSSLQCDGIRNCVDSSDESHCLSLNESGPSVNGSSTQLLSVIYQGRSGYYVCAEGWNDSWSDAVCKQMGYGKAVATSSEAVNGSFLSLNLPQSSSSNFMAFLSISNCSSQDAVGIGCANLECGKRAVSSGSVGPYILNGQRAARGAWPWQVAIYKGVVMSGQFVPVELCGGSLLDDRWVLTAAHCTWTDSLNSGLGYTGQTRPGNLQVVLGTTSLLTNPDTVLSNVSQVHTHPLYNPKADPDNDVGLLKLATPVTFGETIQPICLPDPNQDLNRFRVCVDTGFGKTLQNSISHDLLQAKMNIMTYSECSPYNKFLRNQTQLCVGTLTYTPDINICLGDSGGPLSCQDQNGAWVVIGVNSYVVGTGSSSAPAKDICQLSVVARVTNFLDWIRTTISRNSV